MQAKLCDRCGAVIKEKRKRLNQCASDGDHLDPKSDWGYIFERLDYLKLQDRRDNLIGYLDLCDNCKRAFVDWVHQGSLYTK